MRNWLRRRIGLTGSYFDDKSLPRQVWTQLDWWLADFGWPFFECGNCIGMQEYGCYCAYHDAIAPGCGPERTHLFWRWVHHKIFGTHRK